MTPSWLSLLVVVAAVFALGGIVATILATRKFGTRSRYAPSAASEAGGARYALLAGMMPQAKESVRHHLPTYVTGILYHLGIAAGFGVLIATLLAFELSGAVRILLLVLTLTGAAAGIGLLGKRAVTRTLRALSTPDDVLSNGLVTAFLIAAAATLFTGGFRTPFLMVAVLLLFYIPLGKIRHCFLFFFSRVTFGRFFGRRGVLPPGRTEVRGSHVGR